MAQNGCQAIMFKVKKLLNPVCKKLKDKNIIVDYKTKVIPYNYGYQLKINSKHANYDQLYNKYKSDENKLNILDKSLDICQSTYYVEPESFFEGSLEKNEETKISACYLPPDRFIDYKITSKNDIKPTLKKIENNFIKLITDFSKLIDDL
jgi:hypothetical protein